MEPIINHDEFIGKTVGRRVSGRIAPATAQDMARWRDAGFGLRVRRGVYRFHSFEEADAWLMDHSTRQRES